MNPQTSRTGTLALGRFHPSIRAAHTVQRCHNVIKTDWQGLSSLQLLQSCLTRYEESAWVEFVGRFQSLIATVVRKTLRRCMNPNMDMGLVDDLVQETYLKLLANNFKALRQFDYRHEHALAGFLKVVASNVTQDHLRGSFCTKRGGGKGEDDLEQAVLWTESSVFPAEQMEREITLHQVQQCLERELAEPHLTRDCKIFWLYYRHGLTARAISRRADVGLTTKGVESALFRLTQMLKVKLGRRLPCEHRSNEGALAPTLPK